ncbi:hypothetical protein BJ138DRAFT_69272 [Hygrophoropsis aurantiaca]|uniref:Uncharacterized protein n=1 Tax=Hygrophoropsis aurantiaca TaxID=72124 RepID=A0ACB8ACB8_9AGAM|nr:hypothetical protein BJ138DRAFT_69272 [Hygrophoropsis aurantiaca]
MAFYLQTEYAPLATAPSDNPGDIDIFSDPFISVERTAAFWDIFGAIWSTCPKAPDADAPLRHGVVSDVGIGIGYQQASRVNPPAQRAQEEEVDTAHSVVEDLNDKILADAGTISALQNAIEYLSRRQEEDRRQSHDDLAAKQATIDCMGEQMADKDLVIMDLHMTARIMSRRHEEGLSKMQEEVAAKQRATDELKSGLDESAKERAQQQLELIALRQEVLQLKDANSELTTVNSTLKAHLDKLSDAVVQMFPGSDDEDEDYDEDDVDEDEEEDDDDDDTGDQDPTPPPPPAPQMVSRIPRYTSLLKCPKKPLLSTTSLFPRVIGPDAALTSAMMQPDAVVSSFLPTSTPASKFKTRSVDILIDVPRRRLPLQKTPCSKVTSTSTNTSTRTKTSTSTIASPKKAAKKVSARKSFRF